MINRKNLPLYIALAVPVAMILLVAAFIYLPGVGASPKYNFVYMTGNNSYYGYGLQQYQVNGGRLVKNPPPPLQNSQPYNYAPPIPDSAQVRFYVYDVGKNSAEEVSFDQAAALKLDSSNTSPDNYVIQRGNGGGDFLFGGVSGDYNSWFIKGHNRSKKLNLKLTGGTDYYYNFQFLGWVE